MVDVTVIGCGIVGAAVAHMLSRFQLHVLVMEKENDVAMGASRANSGVLHAGYDPKPGTLMAELNVQGAQLAKALCETLDVPRVACGSLVLAFSKEEEAHLEKLLLQGKQNGVKKMALWGAKTLREKEPHISEKVLSALCAEEAAIVSPWEYTLALAEVAIQNGVRFSLGCTVLGMVQTAEGILLQTSKGDVHSRFVINAAGVYAGVVHDMLAEPAFSIQPSRGSYYLLDKSEGERVRHVVFGCPGKTGKGVLVAPTVHGNLIVGPNSEKPRAFEDVATTQSGISEVRQKAGVLVPGVDFSQNIRCFSGLRAGADRGDFIIEFAKGAPRLLDVAGIASPGLTAAPAIAKRVAELLQEAGLTLLERQHVHEKRKRLRFAALSTEEKQALVAQNPKYGQMLCRCMHITEGEVQDALHTPIPPHSLGGVKRRCGPGMGRCQGGFCSPRVLALLAEHHGVCPTQIPLEEEGSFVLCEDRNREGEPKHGQSV